MASAQMRGGARLTRTRVTGMLAVAVTLCVCTFYAYVHGVFGMGVAGGFAPRLLIGELGLDLLWVPLAGILILAFDFRETDVRNRIAEALDAKPASNLALIAGRLAGTVGVVAVPVVVAIAVLQLGGWIARRTDYWMGDPFEPYSLVGFMLVDVIPALVLWCATVMLLSATLRNRLAVLVTAVSLLAVQVWLMHDVVSVSVLPVLLIVSHATRSASDLVPWVADPETLLHRGSMIVMAAGFCLIAAVAQGRRDGGSRTARLVVALSLVAVSVAGIGTVAMGGSRNMQQREAWLGAHRDARQDAAAVPDLEELSGSVRMAPGRMLEVDVEAAFEIPDAMPNLLFTLNPGLRIASVSLDGRPAEFTHQAGLLVVHPAEPLPGGARGRLALSARGIPDPQFGYLESALDWRRRGARNLIRHLGTRASVFHRNYVALTPAVHWLPTAGTVVDLHPDFFRLDLRVEAPADWHVAGPGRRPPRASDGATRFSPRRQVREVALYASRFARRVVKLRDIEVELLASRGHMPNLEYFAPAIDAAAAHLDGLLASLERGGLPYEDRVLTVVEVPATLRTYRGVWLLDPIRSPGALLLREERLPLARFGHAERHVIASGADLGIRDWRLQQLFLTLSNSVNHGSADIRRLFAGALLDTTAPAGTGSTALDYVCRELAFRSLFPWALNPYGFSAHAFDTDAPFGSSIGDLFTRVSTGHYGHLLTSQDNSPLLWADAAAFPLSEMDDLPPRRAANVLLLKAGYLAQAIVDTLGAERTMNFLGELRGLDPPFPSESFIALAYEADADVGKALEQAWLEPGLPGFVASPVEVVPLRDVGGDHAESYQITVQVSNEQPVSGAVRLGYDEYAPATDPVWVPGGSSVEIGLVATLPPVQLWLFPYLSLNREAVRLALPRRMDGDEAAVSRFAGAKRSSWRPPATGDIVVDDLDAGFSTTGDKRRWRMPALFRRESADRDEGLPGTVREAGEWIRRSVPGSWGRYRRTLAQAGSGDGGHGVVFEASLATGRWRLDYHLPPRLVPPPSPGGSARAVFPVLGSMVIELVVGSAPAPADRSSRRRRVDFDAGAGHTGWNTLGEFDIAGGPVRVEVTNQTDGQAVLADAIRWRRLE